jgi:hypothetical protein
MRQHQSFRPQSSGLQVGRSDKSMGYTAVLVDKGKCMCAKGVQVCVRMLLVRWPVTVQVRVFLEQGSKASGSAEADGGRTQLDSSKRCY